MDEHENKDLKSIPALKSKGINDFVLEWYGNVVARGLPINGCLLQESAKLIANKLEINDFSASNGWLEKFCKRHNISLKVLSGESAFVSNEVIEDWKIKIPKIIKNYSPEDIYNVDETALFYKMLPKKSLGQRGEKIYGSKQSKTRITIMLCANLKGEKETSLVINTSTRPRCFKNRNLSKSGAICHTKKSLDDGIDF